MLGTRGSGSFQFNHRHGDLASDLKLTLRRAHDPVHRFGNFTVVVALAALITNSGWHILDQDDTSLPAAHDVNGFRF